jgi:hypothetical protein
MIKTYMQLTYIQLADGTSVWFASWPDGRIAIERPHPLTKNGMAWIPIPREALVPSWEQGK